MRGDEVVHGFAGYFTCTLYKDVVMSTLPHDHSEGMFSWFPAFLPLRLPCLVAEGSEVELDVWRRSEAQRKMWYEWAANVHSSPLQQQLLPLQNLDGTSYSVSL